jgi:hypothetical protein
MPSIPLLGKGRFRMVLVAVFVGVALLVAPSPLGRFQADGRRKKAFPTWTRGGPAQPALSLLPRGNVGALGRYA